MPVKFRTYKNDTRFGQDYYKLREFLINLNDSSYHFGRWDWMITHGMLDINGLEKIGIWEDSGEIVALATYDTNSNLDGAYWFPYDKKYACLLGDIFAYAKENLAMNGVLEIAIRDGDEEFQNTAAKMGFVPTQDKECDSMFPIDVDKIDYTLPEGFTITSMKENYDLIKYGQVLWKGFNHEANGEGPFVFKDEDLPEWDMAFHRPNVNLDLKIAVVAPNGDFVSYCGMWHDPASKTVLVEPVATDPAYRRMGLGRAAVLEAIRRCGKLGATNAFVVSSQQFYYSIGFRPVSTSTFWKQL